MNSTSLIGQYISHDQRIEIVKNLTHQLKEGNGNVDVLVEFLNDLEIDSNTFNSIESYCLNHILEKEYNNDISKLTNVLPKLRSIIVEKICSLIEFYIQTHKGHFDTDYLQLFHLNTIDQAQDVSEEDLNNLLSLLEMIVNHNEHFSENLLDKSILILLGSIDETTSNEASNISRWRMNILSNDVDAFDLLWDVIFFLINSKNTLKQYHGYVLWLRFINSSEGLEDNQKFQLMLDQNIYWEKVQLALGEKSHELRKYGMFILQMSIKSINSNIQNDYIVWDVKNSKNYIREWERYITLYEVLAIDTSLHQAKAGVTEIKNLISPTSLIQPSWGWCLLSTGFQAANDSVRKFTLTMLLSIPSENLYLIKDALTVLEYTLLPNLIFAPNFDVRTVNGIVECPYVDKLKNTIQYMVFNLKEEKELQDISACILKFIASKGQSFGPARILVLHGLLLGLNGRKVLQYGIHDKFLETIFQSTCEGGVLQTYYQTINLRLTLNFETNLVMLLSLLDKFVRINGINILNDNIPLFEHETENEPIEETLSQELSIDQKVLLLGITTQTVYLTETDSLLLAKLLEFGFRKATLRANEDRLKLLVSSDDSKVIEALSKADYNTFKFAVPSNEVISNLWTTLEKDIESRNVETLDKTCVKFKLFNKLYENSSFTFEKSESILSFNLKLIQSTQDISKHDRFFYKVQGKLDAEYYKSLTINFNKNPSNFTEELKILNPNTQSHETNLSMVELISSYLNSSKLATDNIPKIVSLLSEMWSNVLENRLLLNQQDLHLLTIDTIMNPAILFYDGTQHETKKFCESIIENSTTRRSLLPRLISSLVNAQLANKNKFEQLNWLPEILINASLIRSSLGSYFLLIGIMSDLFDKEVALSKSSDIYNEVYGPEEVSAKVNLSAIFNSIQSPDLAQKIYNYMIENQEPYRLFKPLKWSDHMEEWNRLQLYSILTSLIDKIEIDFDLIKGGLDLERSPLVRMYIEWMISYNMFKENRHIEDIFDELKSGSEILKPSVFTSYVRTLYLTIVKLDEKLESTYITQLINQVILGCSSSKKMIRHFSLSLIVSIHDELKKKNLQVDSSIRDVVESIYISAINSDNFKHFRSGDALLWDILDDLTLVSLNGGIVLRLTDRSDIDFINEEQFKRYLSEDQIKQLRHPIGNDETDIWIKEKLNEKKVIMTQADLVAEVPLQTKSGALSTVDNDLDIISSGKEVNRSDLIVVSSLVDKPPNLGGICRLCDVLGAGLLTIHDEKVKEHPQFKLVAVTADQWMPMIEVKPDEIGKYLQEKKRDGYTLIGLEQTDKSIVLNEELKFPKKSLMLLGKEREGIPGELLAELDFCVEIKQVGIVRSMNIQTATAVLVHAYSSQHC
ncbi:uncharacterized protein KGF55_000955 [Candida pseudojiufengensis]|uniref:uncharacterized protein n=1 Tax=Candida pseudojiufengensis TaxID=497109 RepID=UPI0022259385|nr:uncharacterized protein KGF55_000955 [Candida pseudojiufengensis]KAI5965593.1 hypothetical protein KGF55_000955 [Candida pseudojiufengensis]